MISKEEKIIEDDQINILDKILKEENKLKIKLKVPKDEFNNITEKECNISSSGLSSGQESIKKIKKKYGYSFNINGFESNSIAYFNEILLGNKFLDKQNCFHIDFYFNNFIKFDLSAYDFCRKMLNPKFQLRGME